MFFYLILVSLNWNNPPLNYDEIKQQAEEYYTERYKKANLFYEQACFMYDKEEYCMTSFNLHQTCENLFYAVRLVFTLENGKQHNLSKLLASVRKYSHKFEEIFPRKTEDEKRLFNLLKLAYVEARYNPDFQVTKEDIDTIVVIVEKLFVLVKELCEQRIEEYEQMK